MGFHKQALSEYLGGKNPWKHTSLPYADDQDDRKRLAGCWRDTAFSAELQQGQVSTAREDPDLCAMLAGVVGGQPVECEDQDAPGRAQDEGCTLQHHRREPPDPVALQEVPAQVPRGGRSVPAFDDCRQNGAKVGGRGDSTALTAKSSSNT